MHQCELFCMFYVVSHNRNNLLIKLRQNMYQHITQENSLTLIQMNQSLNNFEFFFDNGAKLNLQKLSYHKQIARKLPTQYVEGIYNNPVTLKSRLRITRDHCKWNHWIDHTWLTIIMTLKCGLEVTQDHWKWYHLKAWLQFPMCLPY